MTATLTYAYAAPYEPGELTAAGSVAGARTATSGATGNRPAGSGT
jgi:hypothetical protein